jgi:DNA-binding beta-propeller fold protein YncE
VYILNEGNFGRGNSTLAYYDDASHAVFQDVFSAVNNRPLGDVGNSMVIRGGRAYIVVNNSHKIEIIDLATDASAGTIVIGAGRSPRQMAFMNDSLALVTCLYDASVLEVNVKTMAVVRRIAVGPNPEGIAIVQGKAFVANSGLGYGNTLSILDLGSLSVTHTLTVGDNPVDVSVTPAEMLYVVCVGFHNNTSDPTDDTPAYIAVIDPAAEAVIKSVYVGGHAYHIAMSKEGLGYIPTTDSVIVIDTRVHASLGVLLRGRFYGVGVDDGTHDIYLSDAKNHVQPGTVFVYSASGQLRTQFDVGVNPGTFAFKR